MLGHLLRVRLAALAAVGLTVVAATSFAQTAPRPGTGDRWEPDRLRRTIEQHYRVVPLQDGVALVPRRAGDDVKSIELSGDTIAINGTPVTGSELRERVRSESDAILALSYMDPAARRALFEPGQPAAAQPPPAGRGDETERGEPTERPRSTHTGTRVHIGGGVHVGENESVDGPVVAIGGDVTVDGEVREDVVAVAGNVVLGPKSRVRGDVTSVGGTVQRDLQAEVDGKVNEISFGTFRPNIHFGRIWLPGMIRSGIGSSIELLATLFRVVLFGLLAVLVFLVARNPVERIERAAAAEPWKAGLVGLLTELFFIPFFVLLIVILAVSIIGIPLLLFLPPLAILAFIAAFVVGFTGVAFAVGRWMERRFRWTSQSGLGVLLVGLLAIWALTIAGRIVSFGGWPIWFASAALLLVGFLVEYVAWTVGLGAAVITRLGTRPAGGSGPIAPAAPPVSAPPAGGAA